MLLPGDPGRAMRLAQALLDEPKMFNHNRGLWGYTGTARDGQLLTIQATGMGGPSTAIVTSELVALGAKRLLRVGTCGGLDPALALGQLVAVTAALCDDGTSRSLGGYPELHTVTGSPEILAGLIAAGAAAAGGSPAGADTSGGSPQDAVTSGASPQLAIAEAVTVSTDLFYDAEDRHDPWRAAGASVVEMEAAPLFTLAAMRGVQAGCALLVSDTLTGGHVRISDALLTASELALGNWALAALRD